MGDILEKVSALLVAVCVLGCSSSSESRTLLILSDGGELDATRSGGAGGVGGSGGFDWRGDAGLGDPCNPATVRSDCHAMMGMLDAGIAPSCVDFGGERGCSFPCTSVTSGACADIGGECVQVPPNAGRACIPL